MLAAADHLVGVLDSTASGRRLRTPGGVELPLGAGVVELNVTGTR